mgnify:CR=1 FL=1
MEPQTQVVHRLRRLPQALITVHGPIQVIILTELELLHLYIHIQILQDMVRQLLKERMVL